MSETAADYTLADFVAATYQDLPQYIDCGGISIERVRALHRAEPSFDSEGTFSDDYAWFMHLERGVQFDLYVYEGNSWCAPRWQEQLDIGTVDPFVRIHGTTFDGVRACWFSDTEPCCLTLMADCLTAADAELTRRGWTL